MIRLVRLARRVAFGRDFRDRYDYPYFGWRVALTRSKALMALLFMNLAATAASAAEVITFTYDALGRVVTEVHTGSVNNGVQVTVVYDAAGNRMSYTTTAS
jgi:YD repeat-containing protein